jgi:glutamine cyclotransferase
MRPLFVCLLLLSQAMDPALAACPLPKLMTFRVEKELRRDALGFTEGLEWHDGAIWESTGDLFGESRINRIDPVSGHVTSLVNAGKSYFGEGLTIFRDRIYQMTWQEHRVFVFDTSLRRLPELKNPREGWGLTHDNEQLIASDGSSRLFFLNPVDFSERRSLGVMWGNRRLSNLNELEWVDGAIWANVFEDWNLVRISPVTGCVEATVDLTPLRQQMKPADRRAVDYDANFVPNGIAHDGATGQFMVTGKYWPLIYFGRFSEVN